MHNLKSNSRLLSLLLIIIILVAPVAAQKKSGTAKKPAPSQPAEPAVTFDTLLTDDSYKIYSEIRNVGQLVRSQGLNELLDPLIKSAEPPKEFKTVLKWLNTHAEALAASRMFASGWPSRPRLPSVLIAVEFVNPEEAKKFEASLRALMPRLMAKPSPAPAGSPVPANAPTVVAPLAQNEMSSPEVQYAIKQTGSLVLLSDKPFLLRDLKPPGSKLLFEDPNFALARNRFASEPIFIYVDVKSIENEQLEQRKKWEAEADAQRQKEAVATEAEVALANPTTEPSPEELPAPDVVTPAAPNEVDTSDQQTDPTTTATAGEVETSPAAQTMDLAMMSLWSLIFGGQPKWPEAVGVALAFEGDGYILRALVVNGPDSKANAIPFITQLASGPGIVPGASSVIPADNDLFVSLSLDYPQMYEAMLRSVTGTRELSMGGQTQPASADRAESPFAAYEKKIGVKFKEDIIPLLGHELAIALLTKQPAAKPESSPGPASAELRDSGPTVTRTPDLLPVIAVAVKDKEAVRQLIPKIIDGMSIKGASLLAQTEKREGTELVSYANMFAYAFIDNFLILSPDAATTRRAIDAYVNNKTLASDSNFRNATRWQPREVQGQLYAGAGLIDLYNPLGDSAAINDKMMELLGQLNPVINPLTYALSNDGTGYHHELHLPRNLLLMMIAGLTVQPNGSPIFANESIAQAMLRTLSSAESSFQSTTGAGRFGTIEELEKAGLLSKDMFEKNGYKIEVSVMSNKFEATATPIEYGKTGRRSFFVDESGVLRGGDHGGGAATISDKPVE